MNNPGRIHRAWWMLIGCCLLQGGSLGIVHNCRGIFYAPVIDDLGFGMGAFSFYIIFFGVCSCFVLPFVGKLFRNVDSRILLGGASLVFSGTVFVMGFFRTLPAFYIAGAIQGFASAFLMFFPAPYILGNWFYKKRGLAVGLSAAFAGLAGVLGNPLGNAIIRAFGWRMGFFSFGLISLVMMFPVSVFLLRRSPEDVGCRPYGAEDDGALTGESCPLDGVPAFRARRESAFWLLILAGLLAAFTCAYYAHLSPLGIYFGYGSVFGALMVSCSMAGNVVSKLLLGQLYDRFGLRTALAAGTAAVVAGFLLLLVDSLPVRIVGSFLYGFSMAMSAIMIAITIRDVYGSRDYGDLLSYSSMASTLGTSVNIAIIGYMVDGFGRQRGYIISLWYGLALTLAMGALLIVSIRGGRKIAAEYKPGTAAGENAKH